LLLALLPAYVRLASSMPTTTSAEFALRVVALRTAREDILTELHAKVRHGKEIASVVPCDLEDNEGTVFENVYVLELLDMVQFKTRERLPLWRKSEKSCSGCHWWPTTRHAHAVGRARQPEGEVDLEKGED
jgi:hypothetical protein